MPYKKYLLTCLFISSVAFAQAQKQAVNRPRSNTVKPVDAFEMNVIACFNNIIRLAENPKKDHAFLTKELIKISNEGEPTYTAPFPMPGFEATLTKGSVDRKKGLVYWTWETKFIEAPKGKKASEIEVLANKADSIAKLYRAHFIPDKANAVAYITVSRAIESSYRETNYASVVASFTKPFYQTEQQVTDSLVRFYQPLLSDPASAKRCTRQFCYAFLREGFEEEKAKKTLQSLLPAIAAKSIEAVYQIAVGSPYFIKAPDITSQLTASQNETLKQLAIQGQKEYEAYWRKLQGKSDPVVAQQKKLQTAQAPKLCEGYGSQPNVPAAMLVKGITVTGFINNTPYFGMLTGIDCKTSHVIITKPGTTKGTEPPKHTRVHFLDYGTWKRHVEQYYTCSTCGGEGGEESIRTESKTKELPFGYFDGIRTTVTKTTTQTVWVRCSTCRGTGLALEKDKDPLD